jgi:hypothetical protein
MSRLGRASQDDMARVRIPADIEREDKLLAGLTARQLAIMAASGVVLWIAYAATRRFVPLVVFGVLGFPLATTSALLALGRFEGVAADRWVLAAWRHHRSEHQLVPAPDGVPAPPSLIAPYVGAAPAPLHLPFAGVDDDGVVDLGVGGLAVLCRASAVTFSLRTSGEQEALVGGFARWLNSLAQPAQILVRAEPFDLQPSIVALLASAPELPHPALEAAARAHAHFLNELAQGADLLRREVLVVLRTHHADGAPGRLVRSANEATVALGAAGVTLVVLDAHAAAVCLTRALDPGNPGRLVGTGGTNEPVRLARIRSAQVATSIERSTQ